MPLSVSIRRTVYSLSSLSFAVETSSSGFGVGSGVAATVGVGIDRLIAKYSRISPSKALMLQAIGAERIEALCNAFCNDLSACDNSCIKRFSPGYGDLPLEVQRDIFSVLDCGKYIGVSLNGSLVMSPSKSVTAFAVASEAINKEDKCRLCGKKDCEYRGAL